MENRKIIKVFLGSPDDLKDERKAAKHIVDEENFFHTRRSGYDIQLVRWEDLEFISQRRRPQEIFNESLDQCDHFVGMLWKKWGTSPGPEGHPYTSGFHEEYERAKKRHDETGKPEISLLFKKVPEDMQIDRGSDVKKILNFKKKVYGGKNQFCREFDGVESFSTQFRAIVASLFENERSKNEKSNELELQKPKPEDPENNHPLGDVNPSQIFDVHATEFIDDFIKKQHDGDNSYSAFEVARFRLLANSVSQYGNDNILLGVHDTNLIYRYLRDEKFSAQEKRRLVLTAIEYLESSTVPLWHWIFLQGFKINKELPLLTIEGGEKCRRNAFRLLGILAVAPKDFESRFGNSGFRDYWFSETLSDDLIISALEYLGVVGDEGFQMDWNRFISSSDTNVSSAAFRSCARIKLRVNKADAFDFVAKHGTIDIGSELTDELLSKISTVETEVLRKCLSHSTRKFRRAIATNLLGREALTESDAYLICESDEADIRLIGVKALAKINPELNILYFQKLLTKPPTWNILAELDSHLRHSYQGAFGPGAEEFKEYKLDVFRTMPYKDLLDIQRNETLYETEATIALYRNHYRRVKDDLQKNLLDGFDKFCASRRDALSSQMLGGELFIHIRIELIQSALKAFCSNAGKSELCTVREVLEKHDIRFSTELVKFIAKHGEWEDATRVVSLSETIPAWSLYADHSTAYQLSAQALLELGKKRISDVWNLNLPSQVRIQFVVQMPKKQFAEFDDQDVVNMLHCDSEVVRAVVALRAVLCLPKARIQKILNTYFDAGGTQYYNAIFWLDLGVSADRDTSRAIARNAISEIS